MIKARFHVFVGDYGCLAPAKRSEDRSDALEVEMDVMALAEKVREAGEDVDPWCEALAMPEGRPALTVLEGGKA